MPKVASKQYNLKKANPKLAKQWHSTKNGDLTPKDVTPGSQKKVWWQCQKNHQWQATIVSRNNGIGCPYCSGRFVSKDNCLKKKYPELAKEWHPTFNGEITPENITTKSVEYVWWQCDKGHEWQESPYNRIRNKLSCPSCINTKRSLAVLNPQLAKEWHPTKNGKLTPDDVTPQSKQLVWWKCQDGHVWWATVLRRSKGGACPECKKKMMKKSRKMTWKEIKTMAKLRLICRQHTICPYSMFHPIPSALIFSGLFSPPGH